MKPAINIDRFDSKSDSKTIKLKDETSFLKAQKLSDALRSAINQPTKKRLFGQLTIFCITF